MKIPKSIKIGEHNYNVKKVRIVNWKNRYVSGQINYGTKTIKIKEYEKDERINQDTFFNEIAHGILKELEYNYPKISAFRNDEGFVQELGLTLRNVFIDLLKNQEDKK